MASEKSYAIVLRVIEFSETSCVVTLFTREFGKITAMAKGARRRNSPFESALDVLSIVRVVFIHKTTDAMDLLTEAKLERRFRSASSNLDRLNCAYYLAELLSSLTEPGDPIHELYDLAERTLMQLDCGEATPFWTLAQFEMKMLEMVGHAPMLEQCVGCGNEVELAKRQFFSPLAGGLYCSTCRTGKKSVITLSHEAWLLLDSIKASQGPLGIVAESNEPYAVASRNVAGLGEVREAFNQFVAHLLGKRPRLQDYLKTPARKS